MPSSVHHLFLPQVKKTERGISGYAKFSNKMNVNMVRYSSGCKAARQKLVNQLWRVKKESEALVQNFTKKGGFRSAWNRSLNEASFYTPQNQFFLILLAGVINPGAAYAHTAMRACLSSGSMHTEEPIKKNKTGCGGCQGEASRKLGKN
jgi:hypothetical protein